MALLNFRAPPLPLASRQYDKPYFDQFVRVLNLIFSQIDSTTPIQADYFIGRGTSLSNPHIGASDDTDQFATGTNVPTLVNWNTQESAFGFTLNPPGSATATYPGVYRIDYSLQLANNDNAPHDVAVWLRVDGVDVPNSTTIFTVPARKNVGNPGFMVGYSTVVFTMEGQSIFELYWATSQAATSGGGVGTYIHHDPVQTTPYPRPAIPSAIGAITFISALP